MVNYAMYYGASKGYDGYKMKITRHIPKEWKLFMVTRDVSRLDLGREGTFHMLYNHPVFKKKLGREEIEAEERWLGRPFRLLLEYNYNWEPKNLGIDEYYELLAKYSIAWRDFFRKNRIDYFTSTHEASYLESVGLHVCRKLGIPCSLIKRGTMSDTYFLLGWDANPLRWKKTGRKQAQEIYAKIIEHYRKKAAPVNKYHAKERSRNQEPTLSNLPKKIATLLSYASWRRGLPELERVRWPTAGKMLHDFLLKNIRKKLGPLYYDKIDPKDKFFLFTISYPKEAKNSYSEWCVNPFEMIRMASECLPVGHWLYVKPHFIYGCEEIPLSEIRRMKSYGNVKFVRHELSAIELLQKSAGLIHVSSTTGIEAAALGKPVITFGHYNFAKPGVSIVVRDLNDLPEAMMGVLQDPDWGIDPKERRRALIEEYRHLIFIEGKSFHHQITDNDGKKIAGEIVDYARAAGIYNK